MNYQKIYDDLIQSARERCVDGYYESHHIIPRCMGGNDDRSNLVNLTPEEHYVAHQLLVKIYPKNPRLLRAAIMMNAGRKSNKLYGWLKRKYSELRSIEQMGTNNSQYGTKWIHNTEINEEKKIRGKVPKGWKEGRLKKEKTMECVYCKNIFKPKFLEIFCSSDCKKYYIAPSRKIIDENLEDMVNMFKINKSITKTLNYFELQGRVETRPGTQEYDAYQNNPSDKPVYLAGHVNNNILKAGAGNDWLYGGGGTNELTGGGGSDIFIYKKPFQEFINGNIFTNNGSLGAMDTITDFTFGKGPEKDVLMLKDLLLGFNKETSDVTQFFAFEKATDGSLKLKIDHDGEGFEADAKTPHITINFISQQYNDLAYTGDVRTVASILDQLEQDGNIVV
jgi:hypothetical protein